MLLARGLRSLAGNKLSTEPETSGSHFCGKLSHYYTECFVTCGADSTPKNNGKRSYKYTSRLSLFMRYNEFSVLINNFAKDAQNDHLACTRLVIHLVTLSIVPDVSRICRKPCSILFRSISTCLIDVACTIDFKCPHK